MAARYYKYNGKKLPSVTTITGQLDKSGPLTYWAANCACDYILNEIEKTPEQNWPTIKGFLYPVIESARKNFRKVSSQALDIGSAVHTAIEHYLKTGQEPQAPSDQVLSAFLAFLEWLDKWETWETLYTEHTVYGIDDDWMIDHSYAGMADWFVILDGKRYVVDFKSSKGIYDEMKYQVAAYRATDKTIEGCGILRLDKENGLPEWKDTSDTYEKDLEVFRILTQLYYATHKF